MDIRYSVAEKIDMIYIYSEAHKNARVVCNLYAKRYPERKQSSTRSFQQVAKLFSETGSVAMKKRHRMRTVTGENSEIAVLATVADNLQVSSRQIERDSGISRRSLRISTTNSIYITFVCTKSFMEIILKIVSNFINGLYCKYKTTTFSTYYFLMSRCSLIIVKLIDIICITRH